MIEPIVLLFMLLASITSNSIIPGLTSDPLTSDEACLVAKYDSKARYDTNGKMYWPYFSDKTARLPKYNSASFQCYTRAYSGALNILIPSFYAQLTCPDYSSIQVISGMYKPELNVKVSKAYCLNPAANAGTSGEVGTLAPGCVKLTSSNNMQGIVGWTTALDADANGKTVSQFPFEVASFTVSLIRAGQANGGIELRTVENSAGIEWYPKTWQTGDTWEVCATNRGFRIVTLHAALIDNWLPATEG